jgi:hypothetical protein
LKAALTPQSPRTTITLLSQVVLIKLEQQKLFQFLFDSLSAWNRMPSRGQRMARFYEDVPIQWKEGETTYGRGLGNHVAWRCKCDHLMLAPHEELYFVPPCPTCGRKFRVVKGKKPRYVKRVIERMERPYRPT